jgi:anaerobic magnesium-protoporphyrin IX monomethyl ester cyclase
MNQASSYHISLVSPPSRAKSVRPPLGLMYIAANLRNSLRDVSVDIVDLKSSSTSDLIVMEIMNHIRKVQPNMVGLSCLSTDTQDVKDLAARIKQYDRKIMTVVGGIHPTLFPDDLLRKSENIDFIVAGEGEAALVELVSGVREHGELKEIAGIGGRQHGDVFFNTARKPLSNLDALPMPAFDLVDMAYYTQPSEWVIRGVPVSGFYIFTGRGCPYTCRFCVNKNLSYRKVRLRSAASVVDEIEHLVNTYNIDGFFIYDDAFGLHKRRTMEICDELMARKMNLVWGCQARVNLISEDMIRKMKAAGCIQLEFGVESGSQRVLERLRKRITTEEVRHVFAMCDRYGIRTLANYLINVPGETMADVEATFDLATDIRANINLFNITTLFPGSDLYYEFQQEIPEEDLKKFASQDDIDEFLYIIENKYKLSDHNVPIPELLKMISNRFPVRGNLALKWDSGYLIQLWKLVSFMYQPNYLNSMLHSKRKTEYLQLLFTYLIRAARGLTAQLYKG